eukprot:6490401-Amphidinium_carterae.5
MLPVCDGGGTVVALFGSLAPSLSVLGFRPERSLSFVACAWLLPLGPGCLSSHSSSLPQVYWAWKQTFACLRVFAFVPCTATLLVLSGVPVYLSA